MKNISLASTVSIMALAISLSVLNHDLANAETINYDGTVADYNELQKDPLYASGDASDKAVMPSLSLSGNTITITDTTNLGTTYNAPNRVYGGQTSKGDVTNNTITMTGGIVNNQVMGGATNSGNVSGNIVNITDSAIGKDVLGGSSTDGNVTNNNVKISNATIGKNLIGGFVENGGSANNNKIKISGTTVVTGSVAVGYVGDGVYGANQNTLSIIGGSIMGEFVAGGRSAQGDSSQNSVTISAGTISGIVYGGYADNAGSVEKNTVSISDGTINKQVFGGRSVNGNVDSNTVFLSSNAVVDKDVAGGFVNDIGNVTNNKVEISGSAEVKGFVFGGYVSQGNGSAYKNAVTINGGTMGNQVFGGRSDKGLASENSIIISNGALTNEVYGGLAYSTGNAERNTVAVNGGNLDMQVYGGASMDASAKENQVTITAGSIAGKVYGGYANDTGSAEQNSVNVNGGTIGGNVFGGFSLHGSVANNNVNITAGTMADIVYGGAAYGAGNAENNNVTISGGILNNQVSGGHTTDGSADGNSISIKNGTIKGNIYGGYTDGTGSASQNNVAVTGGTIEREITGGWSTSGSSTDNKVSISNVTIGTNVVSGYVDKASGGDAVNNSVVLSQSAHVNGFVVGGFTRAGDAKNNQLSISDTTIGGNVYGGRASNGDATGNIITLTGENVKIAGFVYGGYADIASKDQFSGNTLNLNGFQGDLKGIYNVENYNWVLPKSVVNGMTMVHITGTDAVDLTNTKHTVAIENDGNRLSNGDQVTLIDKVTNTPNIANMQVSQGHFIIYNMSVKQQDNDKLVLTINDKADTTPVNNGGEKVDNGSTLVTENPITVPSSSNVPAVNTGQAGYINPRTKAFSEGRAASLGFVSQGADLIADYGIRSARVSAEQAGQQIGQMNLVPFLVMNGSSSTYKTGSHVDVDGFNMAAGLATGLDISNNHLTLGAFFEYGRGTYNSYNSFTSYASVHGDGDTNYTGGGILGRFDFAGTGLGRVKNLAPDQTDGLYLEAALRAGKIDSDFDSDDLTDASGSRGSYDSKVTYYGAHGSIGYVLNFDERNALDVYGRYLWTKMDSDTVDIGNIDKLRFGSSESSRIRVGGRYSYSYNDQLKPYFGAAYEHEFEGDIAAKAYGLKLDKPQLEGDTGIFEAGIAMKPLTNNKALSVDVSGQAFAGQREGGGGGLKIKYEF